MALGSAANVNRWHATLEGVGVSECLFGSFANAK